MNLSDYKCLGFASFTPEKYSLYVAFHSNDLMLLKKKKGNIHYLRLPLGGGEAFTLDLLLEMRCENKHFQLIDFVPNAYVMKNPPIVCDPEWVKKSFWNGTVRFFYKNAALSFHMGVPTSALMPRVKSKKQYYCSIACYAQKIDVFSSEDEFKEKFQIWGVQSVAYPPMLSKDSCKNGLIINGYLRYVEEAINPITEETFYYLIVESMGQTFHIFAASSDFEVPPSEGDIVSVYGLMNGFLGAEADGTAQSFTCNAPMKQAEFNFTVRHMLSRLRDMSYESLTVDVAGMRLGHLQYVQTIRCGKKYVVEIGMMRDGKVYLFQSRKKSFKSAVTDFETILVDKRIPDVSHWKDISKVF